MKINIIKFGGSIISESNSGTHFNFKNTERLALELSPFYKGSVLVHGTGHVGKPPAIKYGYVKNGIISKENILLALEIKSSIRRLNQLVVDTLLSYSIPALPIDIIHFYSHAEDSFHLRRIGKIVHDLLNAGIVPVFYGDLLLQPDGNHKVISSDLLTLLLAKTLEPENVLFLSDVDGIYQDIGNAGTDVQQKIIEELTPTVMASVKWPETDADDVSGGMKRKAELALEIAGFCHNCFIGSGYADNILSKILRGEAAMGTIVKRY